MPLAIHLSASCLLFVITLIRGEGRSVLADKIRVTLKLVSCSFSSCSISFIVMLVSTFLITKLKVSCLFPSSKLVIWKDSPLTFHSHEPELSLLI